MQKTQFIPCLTWVTAGGTTVSAAWSC